MLAYWLSKASPHIKEIQIVFPITGHSFLPLNRVFAQVQENSQNTEVITYPNGYIEVIK